VAQNGELTVRHFDPYSQALAKLERGFDQDARDASALISTGLVDPRELGRLFDAIAPNLYRFPAVDPASLRADIERIVAEHPPE